MDVEVGIGLLSMQATAAAPAAWPELYRRLVDDACLVEDLGFDAVWFAEHRFWYDGWCPQPLVAAAGVAGRTSRLRLGTAMLLLPQHDPLRVAASGAALDRLSGGRLDLGVGLGYRYEEYDGLGLELRHRGARMDEALDVLLAAWTGERVDHEGRHIAAHGSVRPRPVQQPHPRLWVGGMAEPALRRAARRGLGMLLPNTLRLHEVSRAVARFSDEAAAARVPRGPVGVVKDVWVEPDGEAAREFFVPRIVHHYREYAGSWWQLKGAPGFSRPDLLDAQMARSAETTIVGNPEEVAAQLRALVEAGVSVMCLSVYSDVTRDRFASAVELLAREVLPALRETPVGVGR